MSNRNDSRYTTNDDPRAVLVAFINDAPMGGWLDGDREAFEAAVIDEAAHGFGCEPSEVEPVTIERVKLDSESVTDNQIQQLRDEAGAAGDTTQVELCERALEGDDDAREACAEAINDARAMDDGD